MFWASRKVQERTSDLSLVTLKALVLLTAVVLIVVAVTVDNKWALGGVIAYTWLP